MSKSKGKAANAFADFQKLSGFPPEAMSKNLERMYSAFGDLGELNKDGLSAFGESASAAGKGFEAINSRALNYFKDAVESGLEATKTMSSAKSFQEVVEIQTDFAKLSAEKYMAEAGAVASLVAGTMREVAEPLNNHAGALVEKLQTSG